MWPLSPGDALDHLEVAAPELDPDVQRGAEAPGDVLAGAAVDAAHVAQVGELVGGVEPNGLLPGGLDLVAVLVLSPLIADGVLVLGHRLDQLDDGRLEPLPQFIEADRCVLDDVVQQGGRRRRTRPCPPRRRSGQRRLDG